MSAFEYNIAERHLQQPSQQAARSLLTFCNSIGYQLPRPSSRRGPQRQRKETSRLPASSHPTSRASCHVQRHALESYRNCPNQMSHSWSFEKTSWDALGWLQTTRWHTQVPSSPLLHLSGSSSPRDERITFAQQGVPSLCTEFGILLLFLAETTNLVVNLSCGPQINHAKSVVGILVELPHDRCDCMNIDKSVPAHCLLLPRAILLKRRFRSARYFQIVCC